MATAKNENRDYVAIARQYAEQVIDGTIPACRWVKLACQRQIDDLAKKNWQWKWDKKKASQICTFIEKMPHIRGRWKTRNITLEPHQIFRLSTIFGWVDSSGYRRFRKALIVLPRKNGKSTEAAGVGLFLLALDGEPGAEIYSAATTRDQAKISWDVARRMVQKSPGFSERFGIAALAHSIAIESDAAFFKPLSRDADTLEGLNPSGCIVDELHAHKTRECFDVLDEATGSRQQPLIYIISTEGDNAAGVFAEQVSYAQQILEGSHIDDSYFGIVYTIDPEDSWTERTSWYKANPNLGVSVFEKDLEIRCHQAEKNAESQASFLTKRLNVRVGAGNAFFNLLSWNTICKDATLHIEDFYGSPCVLGIDLASKKDMAAKVIRFDDTVFAKFYLPEDAVDRGNPNYDLYRGWQSRGYLTITPGNVIDYAFIERDLLDDVKQFDVQHVGIDPHDATQFTQRMQTEGVPIIEVPQTVLSLSEPMKELDARIVAGRIRHDGNPILGWMMGNVTAKRDAKDNVYPRKARDENKIDGAVGLIMTEAVLIRAEDNTITYMGGFAS